MVSLTYPEPSQKINFKLFDLDKEISLHLGKDIPTIFKEMGELGFRKAEKHILEQLLSSEENIILSLGGGTLFIIITWIPSPDILKVLFEAKVGTLQKGFQNKR